MKKQVHVKEYRLKPRHECGICGVFGRQDAAKLTYFGLYALQHRGQESAGIVASDGNLVALHKDKGLHAVGGIDGIDLAGNASLVTRRIMIIFC